MLRRNHYRTLFCISVFLLGAFTLSAQQAKSAFNKRLADSLGADENGMKMYVLVLLKTGPTQIAEKKTVDSLFAGHMSNIGRLVQEGKLVVAGPLKKNEKNYRGIFILNTPSLEEAKTLVQSDPAVRSGLLEAELFQWWGSAALPMYLPYAEQVSRH